MNITGKTEVGILNKSSLIKTPFVMVSNISHSVIFGTPFMNIITPYIVKHEKISFKIKEETFDFLFLEEPKTRNLNLIRANSIYHHEISTLIKGREKGPSPPQAKKIQFHTFERELQKPEVKYQISKIQNSFKKEVRFDLRSAFWDIKGDTVDIPYKPTFHERDIPTKAWPIQMNANLEMFCRREIS